MLGALSAAVAIACGSGTASQTETTASVAQPVAIKKAYTRKILVHMMPWFRTGGAHWSMNSRNSATGIASWYAPMIGEYNSNDSNVIEYQLLTMKYAGIDGILVDWPGLSGANDLPQNKASADAIINRTAAFGLEFGICYEDQYAASVDAAKNDMTYVRDNFFNKPNHVKVANNPALLVFGPQKFLNAADWTNILSVFPVNPTFFALWYNNNAGPNADGKYAWIAQNGLKGVSDFDNYLDGTNHGIMMPVLYPGFNSYYAQGGWPGPTFKISYTLKADNTEGGDTFRSTFDLGKYSGDPLQIATWNDYGEGTMVEPTVQFQYKFLTTLQQAVGAVYGEGELKIVKLLYDQRKQFGASKQMVLDQASAALANLDLVTACNLLGCTVPPPSTGAGGATGAGGSTGAGGAVGAGGRAGASGATGAGTGGAATSTGPTGSTSTGAAGSTASTGSTTSSSSTSSGAGGASSSTSSVTVGSGGSSATSVGSATGTGGAGGSGADGATKGDCTCSVIGARSTRPSALLVSAVLACAARLRRRRRAVTPTM